MELSIFGIPVVMKQSTSAVPGKLAASVLDQKGRAHLNLFVWDPLSSMLEFDEQQVHDVLSTARRARPGWASVVLMVTDFAMNVVRGVRGLFGGSYGGSLGFGQLGAMVAIMSAVFFIVVAVAAAVVVIPLSVVAWILRMKVNAEIAREKEMLISCAVEFFQRLQTPGTSAESQAA